MESATFSFKKILNDSNDFLLKPRSYFASMNLRGGFLDPIIKVLIYGTVAGLISFLLSLILAETQSVVFVKGTLGLVSLIISVVGSVIGAFICGLIVLILSSICGGNTEFEGNFRVAASMLIFFPLSALLPIFNDLSPFIQLALNLYSVYILYIGLTIALKGKVQIARVISLIFAGLAIIMFILSFL